MTKYYLIMEESVGRSFGKKDPICKKVSASEKELQEIILSNIKRMQYFNKEQSPEAYKKAISATQEFIKELFEKVKITKESKEKFFFNPDHKLSGYTWIELYDLAHYVSERTKEYQEEYARKIAELEKLVENK